MGLGLQERREYSHSWYVGEGITYHEGRMLAPIYDEPLTGSNSPAFKCVQACHGHGISVLRLTRNYPE